MSAPIVLFDIAGPEFSVLVRFYAAVFGWDIGAEGRFETAVLAPLKATIRRDPAETRLYFGVADVAATLRDVEAHGGSVEFPRFEVPGTVVLGLFRDPVGNAMGLVEIAGGKPVVP